MLKIIISTVVASCAVQFAAAQTNATQAPDLFPDTPGNRAIYQRSLAAYEAIKREHGHFAEVNGIRMQYLEWGDVKGVPLIWSHGYSSTAFEMVQVGQALADAGYHVLAITYRGHGETQVRDYDFSLATIADDIVALMDQRKMACAVIGGLSMGGGVTTTFYENYPRRVLGLVLEDGGADAVQLRNERAYAAIQPMAAVVAAHMAPFSQRHADRFLMFRDMVQAYQAGWHGQMPEAIMPVFQSWIRRDDDGRWGVHMDNAKLFGSGTDVVDPAAGYKLPLLHQSWRRVHPLITYRNLSVPLLIIDPTGDDDGPYGSFSAEYERLRAQHPALIEHVKYPDTSHAAHPQRPEWFVRDLNNLLQRVRKSDNAACRAATPTGADTVRQ